MRRLTLYMAIMTIAVAAFYWLGSESSARSLQRSDAHERPGRLFVDGKAKKAASREADDKAILSVLDVPGRMKYGEYVWNQAGVPRGTAWVRVDLARQLISVFRAGHEVGTAVILYGAPEKPTPTGSFEVIAKHAEHRSSLYDADMPFTLRLTNDGIAIHASDVRPKTGTHGCVGVPLQFAKLLFQEASIGTRVLIVQDDGVPVRRS